MKKILCYQFAALIGFTLTALSGFTQWQPNGPGIVWTPRNVGVGTNTPDRKMHVRTSHVLPLPTSHWGMTLQDDLFQTQAGPLVARTKFRLEPIASNTVPNRFQIGIPNTTNPADTDPLVTLFENGNFGIGTTTPNSKLDVDGLIRGKAQDPGGIAIRSLNTQGTRVVDIGNHAGNHGIIRIFQSNGNTETVRLSGKPNENMWFNNGGGVAIGTTTVPLDIRLAVCGNIRANEVQVDANWCDFVFEKDYDLMTLKEVDEFIQANGHLPGIPTTEEVEKNGISLGEINSKLLQKIEELTLYAIEQEKRIEKLENKTDGTDGFTAKAGIFTSFGLLLILFLIIGKGWKGFRIS